jgi:hypothetical protein
MQPYYSIQPYLHRNTCAEYNCLTIATNKGYETLRKRLEAALRQKITNSSFAGQMQSSLLVVKTIN